MSFVHKSVVFELKQYCHQLESRKKDPMEVLDAYGSIHLILFGNSTHLAPWHAKLGFHSSPFVATLGSLTSDGGAVSLTDLIVMKVNSHAYILGTLLNILALGLSCGLYRIRHNRAR